MNKLFTRTFFLMLTTLSVLVVGCSDDDDGGNVSITPAITTVSPTQGPVGTAVTITGINLGDATSVTFGDIAATITGNTATSITTSVPANAAEGAQTITVNTAGGKGTKAFMVISSAPEPPTISSVSPEDMSGTVGITVTISGTSLEGAEVLFGDIAATVDPASTDTKLIFIVPEGAETGSITVTTAGGSVETDEFTILRAPVVAAVVPESMEGEIGDEITITGENLEGVEIYFGDVVVTEKSVSTDTEVSFIIPEGAITGPITLVTTGGEVSTEEFTIIEPSSGKFYVYNDETLPIFSEFEGHGHDPVDRKNAEQVYEGEFATKVAFNYAGWGEFGFSPSPATGGVMSTEGYSEIVVSIYGEPGVSQLNFWLKEKGAANADIVKVKLDVKEGQWTTFTIPLSTLGSKIVDDEVTTPSGANGPFEFIEIKFGATTTGGDKDIPKHTYYFDEIYFQ